MKIRNIYVFILSVLGLFVSSCEYTSEVIENETTSHFPPKVDAILRTSCSAESGCHNGLDPEALNLTTWNQAFIGSKTTPSPIIPYNHNWSHLFQHINTFSELGISVVASELMPPAPRAPLNKEEVSIIKDWILTGAKSAEGEYYWSKQETSIHNKAFVLCSASDLVAVTDMVSNRIMRYISVGVKDEVSESPHYILLSPDKQYFYVTLINGSLIEKYRTDNYQKVGSITVASSPSLLKLSQDGKRLLVSHWHDISSIANLSLINTETMTLLDKIQDDIPYAHGLTTSADFQTIYMTANLGNYYVKYQLSPDLNTFIDQTKIPIEASDPIPGGSQKYNPYQCVLSPDESKLFVSCSKSDEVRVFNTTTNAMITKIATDSFPRLMSYDPVTNRLFVACAKAKNTVAQGSMRGCVSVIDAQNLTFIQNIYGLGHRPHGIMVAPQKRLLYVSSENTGGFDPPHHPTQGTSYPPGKYNVVDLNTLEVIREMETEVAEYPTSLTVSE